MSDFISLLPQALQKDETIKRLAALLGGEIKAIDAITEKLLLYAGLDGQSEEIIDELASSFHMLPDEGYRFADTLDKKREMVRSALTLHRHKGTLYAVKEVLKILGIKGKVLEWFNYGGRPFYFKIDAHVGGGMGEKDIAVLEALLNEFKNVRSHLEGVTFNVAAEGRTYYAAAGATGEDITVLPYIPEAINAGRKVSYGSANTIHEKIQISP